MMRYRFRRRCPSRAWSVRAVWRVGYWSGAWCNCVIAFPTFYTALRTFPSIFCFYAVAHSETCTYLMEDSFAICALNGALWFCSLLACSAEWIHRKLQDLWCNNIMRLYYIDGSEKLNKSNFPNQWRLRKRDGATPPDVCVTVTGILRKRQWHVDKQLIEWRQYSEKGTFLLICLQLCVFRRDVFESLTSCTSNGYSLSKNRCTVTFISIFERGAKTLQCLPTVR